MIDTLSELVVGQLGILRRLNEQDSEDPFGYEIESELHAYARLIWLVPPTALPLLLSYYAPIAKLPPAYSWISAAIENAVGSKKSPDIKRHTPFVKHYLAHASVRYGQRRIVASDTEIFANGRSRFIATPHGLVNGEIAIAQQVISTLHRVRWLNERPTRRLFLDHGGRNPYLARYISESSARFCYVIVDTAMYLAWMLLLLASYAPTLRLSIASRTQSLQQIDALAETADVVLWQASKKGSFKEDSLNCSVVHLSVGSFRDIPITECESYFERLSEAHKFLSIDNLGSDVASPYREELHKEHFRVRHGNHPYACNTPSKFMSEHICEGLAYHRATSNR